MSEDLTKKLPSSDKDQLAYLVTAVEGLNNKTDHINERLDRVDSRLEAIDARLDKLDWRMDNLDSRFQALDQKVEERLYDTRPIWEKFIVDVTQVQEGQQKLEQGQQKLEQRQLSFEHQLTRQLQAIQTYLLDIMHRLSQLERGRLNSTS